MSRPTYVVAMESMHLAPTAQVGLYLRKASPKCQGTGAGFAARQKEIRTNSLKFHNSDFDNRG